MPRIAMTTGEWPRQLGDPLTPKDRKVHEVATCGVLRDLHDELDRLVADAYGWPWPMETEEILARLVALHDERFEEERRGVVRWLRPEYQVPRFGDRVEAGDAGPPMPTTPRPTTSPPGPTTPIEQLTALRAAIADRPGTVEDVARRFRGARRAQVEKHLERWRCWGWWRGTWRGSGWCSGWIRQSAHSEPMGDHEAV